MSKELGSLLLAIKALDNEDFDFTPHLKLAARSAIPALTEMIAQQEKLRGLVEKWRQEAKEVHEDTGAIRTAVAVKVCADEVASILGETPNE